MTWWTYLFPRIVARLSTPYNHDIRILEEAGRYKLLVDGTRQSGTYITSLWEDVFRTFGITDGNALRKILVLGVAGGSVIHLLHKLFPKAEITGVDIDPVMVDIGKKYFSVSSIAGLTIVIADANEFVKAETDKKDRFDLVIVDVFWGRHIPPFVSEEQFLLKLKKLIGPPGKIIINYLRENEYHELGNILLDKLSRIFHSVSDREIFLNRFFMVS